jgi:hypothetical protein
VPDPRVDELWQGITASWGDEAAHAAFIEHCRATGQLGHAAARYREEVRRGAAYREDAGRAETAEKRLRGVMALAMLELQSTRTTQEQLPAFQAAAVVRWMTALVCLAVVIFSTLHFILGR